MFRCVYDPKVVEDIVVANKGSGPRVLLVHGGASPATTFGALDQLASRWTLSYAYRRGYPPSPPWDTRQDFAVDAADIGVHLTSDSHVVAHSYGCLGSLIAAGLDPDSVRSLTIIEPPLSYLAPSDPEAQRLGEIGDEALELGLDADPRRLREFLAIAGSPVDDGPLPEKVVAGINRALGGRPPTEARPDLDAIAAAGIPALVASGDHAPGIEAICDALADRINAERLICPGAGHFVSAAPGFSDRLEDFLRRAESRGPTA